MTRRTAASILASVLLVALVVTAAVLPVPYVAMSPGPTVDLLAERQGEEIVEVEGEPTYPTEGRLTLTTVAMTAAGQQLSLGEALSAWFDRSRALYPRDAVYPPEQSEQDVRQEGAVQMVSSQDTAIAAALKELGYDLPLTAEVLAVSPDAPAQGKLRPRDRILSVAGEPVSDPTAVADSVSQVGVGGQVRFVVRRDGRTRTVTVRTEAAPQDPDRAVVGIVVGQGYDFPFEVSVDINDNIGGSSAGLVFALAVYDTLTRGALTGGHAVAGTGTITAEGDVGPIGGIQQKIVAAADAGAGLFLVPPGNCEAALAAPVDEGEIELVKASTLRTAITALEAYAEGREEDLPRCG